MPTLDPAHRLAMINVASDMLLEARTNILQAAQHLRGHDLERVWEAIRLIDEASAQLDKAARLSRH
ncbi:hypothetical protein SFA35_04000 [Pseudomonas sp. HR96]|uniref:hypothetical protein n=1 Tax=Pseudomonas sp. HR96 TaxID=1027966 RepID=UPI002A74EDE5|nr:hypothetical protein [Pseudomonas sp. HR96]WPP00554.1 hypothetical protein SFA35_04000 [Pseudomonas sp. HR96]